MTKQAVPHRRKSHAPKRSSKLPLGIGTVIAAITIVALAWHFLGSPDSGESPAHGKASITISMVGDVIPYGEVFTSGFDYDTLYENVRDEIASSDVRILSQDTILSNATSSTSSIADTSLACPTAVGDSEASAGFNLILKANEHIFDLGYEGLGDEMDFWKDSHSEVAVIGTDNPNAPDRSQDYVDNVYVYEKDGFKVAFLNYTYGVAQSVSGTDQKYISSLNATKIERDVTRARNAGADMIVACPHWGESYSMVLSEEETTYAQVFAEMGVDVVIGTNPHVLQEVETITSKSGHQTICIYSVGDFISNQTSNTSLVGGLATVTLQKNANGSCSVRTASLEPLVIYRDDTTSTAYPLSRYTPSIAASNLDGTLTRSYIDTLCSQVFGSEYDSSTGRCDIVDDTL